MILELIMPVFTPQFRWFPVWLGLGILLSACGEGRNRNSLYGGSFYMPPADAGTVVFYDLTDPPSLDPARSWGFFDGRLVGLIFSNLVRFNQEAKIVPDLAESWEILDGGRTYTFHLTPQAAFSNGRAITAEDVRYSLERALREKSSLLMQVPIQAIEVSSDRLLTIRLKEPYVPFLSLLATAAGAVVPREAVEESERQGIPFGERPLGSGPWLLEEWKHDQHVLLKRNDTYWGQKPVTPRLLFRIINSPFTAIAEFETGNLAAIDPLPEAEILRWTTHPQWKSHVLFTPLLNIDMLLFNCERPPLDREDVRRALCQAVNAPLMLEAVREGAGVVSSGPIPPGLAGYTPNQPPYPYNPAAAKELLQQSGLSDRPLRLLMPALEGFVRTTGEVVQAQWKDAGISVQLQQVEWVTYRRMMREGDFDIAFRNWFADYPDGDNFLHPLFHSSQVGSSNQSRFRDTQVDELIALSQREPDPARREDLLRRADDLVFEKAPALFLWHRANYLVVQPWLRNYRVPRVFNGTRYLEERIETAIKN